MAINHRIDVKSYTSLHTLVHDMFPPTSMIEQVICNIRKPNCCTTFQEIELLCFVMLRCVNPARL